jgi:hypothetical protein
MYNVYDRVVLYDVSGTVTSKNHGILRIDWDSGATSYIFETEFLGALLA